MASAVEAACASELLHLALLALLALPGALGPAAALGGLVRLPPGDLLSASRSEPRTFLRDMAMSSRSTATPSAAYRRQRT